MGAAVVPAAGVWEVDRVWGVGSCDVGVLPECGEDHGVHFEGCGERQVCYEGGVGASGCDKGVEEEGEGVHVCGCNGEEACPGSDAFVYFGVSGSCVKKETVRAEYVFKGWGAFEGLKMGKAWGKGMGRSDRDCGCGVGGDDWVLAGGASVLVAPVEGGDSGDGSARWQVDGLDPSFAGGGDRFS